VTKTADRSLGTGGPTVSALGMGCWAIGGPHARQGNPVGWGAIDDEESKRALRRAFDLGVTFFDTADVYGCGHSEKLLSAALGDVRDEIVIASKAGYTYDEETREAPGENGDPEYIRWACEQTLRRLGTDHLDLYQFHLGGYDLDRADEVLRSSRNLLLQARSGRSAGAQTVRSGPRCLRKASTARRFSSRSTSSAAIPRCWNCVNSVVWRASPAGRSGWAC
jgi:aryl-alcohol dehydrogenase-like predicted oxidoreductase